MLNNDKGTTRKVLPNRTLCVILYKTSFYYYKSHDTTKNKTGFVTD